MRAPERTKNISMLSVKGAACRYHVGALGRKRKNIAKWVKIVPGRLSPRRPSRAGM
jgi:hypothetical protein